MKGIQVGSSSLEIRTLHSLVTVCILSPFTILPVQVDVFWRSLFKTLCIKFLRIAIGKQELAKEFIVCGSNILDKNEMMS